jgi:hypothetical protein
MYVSATTIVRKTLLQKRKKGPRHSIYVYTKKPHLRKRLSWQGGAGDRLTTLEEHRWQKEEVAHYKMNELGTEGARCADVISGKHAKIRQWQLQPLKDQVHTAFVICVMVA